jgi:hypothetical protein
MLKFIYKISLILIYIKCPLLIFIFINLKYILKKMGFEIYINLNLITTSERYFYLSIKEIIVKAPV